MTTDQSEFADTGSFIPGHCQDIDGAYWHAPGECEGARNNCSGRCCGPVSTPGIAQVALIELGAEPPPEQHALYQDSDPSAPYYDPAPGVRSSPAGGESDG